jgi:hypothetical protein
MPSVTVMSASWSPTCRALLVVVMIVAAACNSPSKPREPPKDAGPPIQKGLSVVQFPEPKVVLPMREGFDLLDKGKGTLEPLRYQLATGTTIHRTETSLSSRRLANHKWGPRAKLPAIREALAITVAGPADPIALRTLRGELARPSAEGEAYLASSRALENRVVTMRVDGRGGVDALVFADDPDNKRPDPRDDLLQRLLATSVPVPEEPIGVGAKWRVTTLLKQRPAVVRQTATYTLVARTKSAWRIGVKIERVAEQQVISDPALGADAAANIIGYVKRLDGTFDVSPASVLPAGTLKFESIMHMRIGMPDRSVKEQIFEDNGTVTLKREKAKPAPGPTPKPAPPAPTPKPAAPAPATPAPPATP